MNKMPFDCETGGIDPATSSLLTLYMAVLDSNDQIIDELDLKLKPDDGKYLWTQEAMDVNGINLEEHDKEAITYSQGKVLLMAFLKKNSPKKRSLRPCGHNIAFDIGFIQTHLLSKKEWEDYCHYRVLDTTPIATFMQDIGVWPSKLGSLVSLVEYLGVKKRLAHNAKEDTLMWIDVYVALQRNFKNIIQNGINGDIGSQDSDLKILEL